MPTPTTTTQLSDIYETLGQLIKSPKSLGLREHLPPRVVAALTNAREILLKEMDTRALIAGGDSAENDLAAELSQDADTQPGIPEEDKTKCLSTNSCAVECNNFV